MGLNSMMLWVLMLRSMVPLVLVVSVVGEILMRNVSIIIGRWSAMLLDSLVVKRVVVAVAANNAQVEVGSEAPTVQAFIEKQL